MERIVVLILMAALAAPVVASRSARADGGDFSLDFIASAPFTYDHDFGGGAYDDRTIGKNLDVVESLEAGDFACFELVTFLTHISVDDGATGAQTIELDYSFTADSTGQSGIALSDIDNVEINYAPEPVGVGDGPGGTDAGMDDDGGSTAILMSTSLTDPVFSKGADRLGTVRVDDLEPGETVVLRLDVFIDCDGRRPTGNLQGRLLGANVVSPEQDAISVGNQTIPFKRVARIKTPPPPPPPK